MLSYLGKVSFQQGNYEQADRYLQNAYRQARSIKNEEAIVSIFTTLAMIKTNSNDFTQADNYFIQALSIGKTLDDKTETFFCLIEVARYFIKQNKVVFGVQLANLITNASVGWKAVREHVQELLNLYNSEESSAFSEVQALNPLTELEKLVIKIFSETF